MNREKLEKLSDADLRAALKARREKEHARLKEFAAAFGVSVATYFSLENASYGLMPFNRERIIGFLSGEPKTYFETRDSAAIRKIGGILSELTGKEQRVVVKFLVEKFTE